jgi:hypothetical protein
MVINKTYRPKNIIANTKTKLFFVSIYAIKNAIAGIIEIYLSMSYFILLL